ncbi:LLM class flavin-dependent oxidoreductase [Yinghuangia sp. ASG 101]|uniref:LLM class flavin-dependent oxidoreductase n=1 Tax=Yinghuangia sp. ASG 101 TaxID=2896848 RepID=UPI001E41920A|nr:LLM class flavin-dependent oxidoreductase [Yinghuangia sp. ASG 101]UGQ10810.1 LLM class flavin-dependent oxidoreductase [Yinghuangia sp. ASG 101]
MAVFLLRFDFRNPAFAGTEMSERYAAALDMVEWADRVGFASVTLSEHHGSEDGYLPSPLLLASAVAARSRRLNITIAAIPAPLHDPVRLAEDLAVADVLSGGRLSVILANGYMAHEFDMFGVSMKDRAKLTTETVHTLRAAWTGEPFEFRGRTIRVTPTPSRPDGPPIILGGAVEAVARRAARIADGFAPNWPGVWEFYRDERVKLGHPDPGPYSSGDGSFLHVSKDPDRDWERIRPHAMHESVEYGAHAAAAGTAGHGGYSIPDDPDELRSSGRYRVVTPEELTAELQAAGDRAFAVFHPLMGGIPPELAWESLRLFETEVLPNL